LRGHFHDELDLGLAAYWIQFGFLHFECVASYVDSLFEGSHWISVFKKIVRQFSVS